MVLPTERTTERPFCNSSHEGLYLKELVLLGHFHLNIQSSLYTKNQTDLEHQKHPDDSPNFQIRHLVHSMGSFIMKDRNDMVKQR
jgi:hypothetical protein